MGVDLYGTGRGHIPQYFDWGDFRGLLLKKGEGEEKF